MFAKLGPDRLKKRANLKNNLLQKLKNDTIESMPAFEGIWPQIFPKKSLVVVYRLEEHVSLYAVDEKPVLVQLNEGQVIPHLKIAMEYPGLLPCVYVDDGAVKALLRGADLMAPGIKKLGETPFEEKQVIEIRLLGTTVPFAIGIAKYGSEQITPDVKGLAITVCHIMRDALYLNESL